MKKIIPFRLCNNLTVTLFLVIIILNSVNSSAQSWQWATSAKGKGNKIAVDNLGNSYVTGLFTDTINFDGTMLISSGMEDIFIVKYNSSGTVQWARKAGSSLSDAGRGIGVDAAGNVYVAGYFSEDLINGGSAPCIFSGTPVASQGTADVFLAKYNSSGVFQWVRTGGGYSLDYCDALSVDDAGNCYLTGAFGVEDYYYYYYYGIEATFSGVTLYTVGDRDIYVAKYESSGYLLWIEQGVGNYRVQSTSITNDTFGNAYITGYDVDGAIFDTIHVNSFPGGNGYFIAKCNSLGWQWAKTCIGTSSNYGYSLCVDASGNVYAIGDFYGQAVFESDTLISPNNLSSFIIKYNNDGNVTWVKLIKSTQHIGTDVIKTTKNNEVIFAGNFSGTLQFENNSLTSHSLGDIFICTADTSGNPSWLDREGDTHYNFCNGLAADNDGYIYFTGIFTDSINIGTIPLVSPGPGMFVAKYAQINVGVPEVTKPLSVVDVFPNPFSQLTTISFLIPASERVSIRVFDISGRLIKNISNTIFSKGMNKITWNATNETGSPVESGNYFLKLEAEKYSETKKIAVIK